MLFTSALVVAMQNPLTIVVQQRAGAASKVDSHALKPLLGEWCQANMPALDFASV